MIQTYRDLRVWQEAMDLAEATYRLAQTMPASESFGLVAQVRRSAVSVPANIAEGYGRESTGSYIQFLKTARGSLRELETHVLLAQRVGLVARQDADKLLEITDNVAKKLHTVIRAIQQSRAATAR